MSLPNLAGVAHAELVESIGGGNFSASYINWSRTRNLLREHAPGWLPELVPATDGGILHRAPAGAFLLLRFVNVDGTATPPVPQAIMDNNNKALPLERITARDITDTHRRGICMAAALTFGLAYELWAKIPLESGFAERHDPEPEEITPDTFLGYVQPPDSGKPGAGVKKFGRHQQIAATALEYYEQDDVQGASDYLARLGLDSDDKVAVWSFLPSKFRTALKNVNTPQEKAA